MFQIFRGQIRKKTQLRANQMHNLWTVMQITIWCTTRNEIPVFEVQAHKLCGLHFTLWIHFRKRDIYLHLPSFVDTELVQVVDSRDREGST